MTTKCILMNFDDRVRIVYDAKNDPLKIGIGAIAQGDLNAATMAFLKSAMEKTNDPLVILPEMPNQSPEVLSLMGLLQDLSTGEYDEVLARSAEILGPNNIGGPRPSREELREKLRLVARDLAYGKIEATPAAIQGVAAAHADKKKKEEETERRRLTDDVNPKELDDALRKQRQADQKRTRDNLARAAEGKALIPEPTERQLADDVLGIVVAPPEGGSPRQLAEALAGGPDDPDAFTPKPSRQRAPSKKKAAKGAKKAAKPPTAKSAKSGPAAKKPVGRVRA